MYGYLPRYYYFVIIIINIIIINLNILDIVLFSPGLSQSVLGMGPGPLELGKIASFRLKLGKKYNVL